MHIVTVVGARPQFVKAAAVSRLLRTRHRETLVHTGQHYDQGMSQVFFDELGLPAPDINLQVGSGSHGRQTGQIIERIEAALVDLRPDALLVYGDTNSTLAGALAAAKLHIPVAHVEAGLRSFNLQMPEEVNRRLTDHISRWLFTPTAEATAQLAREGITEGVYQVGDVMVDVLRTNLERSRATSTIIADLGLTSGDYILATIHRAENTDDLTRLVQIVAALESAPSKVVLPLHPRTRNALQKHGLLERLTGATSVRCLAPVGYLDMLALEAHARQILTDSGGVQKEAYLLGVPCLTVRNETEWVETVATGWNRLLPADVHSLCEALEKPMRPAEHPHLYGDGHAAEHIVAVLD
jgi:UDP-N-acetylglucosamine 2-epimerase